MSEEIKPCPFCGSEASSGVYDDGSGHGESYFKAEVKCSNRSCGVSVSIGGYAGEETKIESAEAMRRWNTRITKP